MEKKVLVVSGVNLSEGGPLTIISNVLDYLNESNLTKEYKIYALVHSKNLFNKLDNIELIAFPEVKKSWINRLKFEYRDCMKISKKLNAYAWISLHDVTPNTSAKIKATYCHNPSPFYNLSYKKLLESPLRFLYTKLYKYLYKINIKKNTFVIVQSQWMRDKFTSMYNLHESNVIVSLPNLVENNLETNNKIGNQEEFIFFYPALAREFKNFEVICEAANILSKKVAKPFRIVLTIDGTENSYSQKIVNKYRSNSNIQFIGLISRNEVQEYYQATSCLLFASKLETWGLPISEFKNLKKPMILVDLPYVYETLGAYDKVAFFDADDPNKLADLMCKVMDNSIEYTEKESIKYKEPLATNWEELFKLVLS